MGSGQCKWVLLRDGGSPPVALPSANPPFLDMSRSYLGSYLATLIPPPPKFCPPNFESSHREFPETGRTRRRPIKLISNFLVPPPPLLLLPLNPEQEQSWAGSGSGVSCSRGRVGVQGPRVWPPVWPRPSSKQGEGEPGVRRGEQERRRLPLELPPGEWRHPGEDDLSVGLIGVTPGKNRPDRYLL